MKVWIFRGYGAYRAISLYPSSRHLPRLSPLWEWEDPVTVEMTDPKDIEELREVGYILVGKTNPRE